MNTRSTNVPALMLSVAVTLATLLGIDTLAVQEHAGTQMAAAAQAASAATATATAKAPATRS